MTWATLTFVFTIVPTVILQIFSLCWYGAEGPLYPKTFKALSHLFLIAPLQRYAQVIRYGSRARKTWLASDYNRLYHALHDIYILRLFEAFLECAPQLLIQVYSIMILGHANWITGFVKPITTNFWYMVTDAFALRNPHDDIEVTSSKVDVPLNFGVSISTSLLSMSWSVASYTNSLRLAYRPVHATHYPSMFVHTLWQLFTVASRILAIVIFASVYHAWIFLALGVHWLLMTAWVILQNTNFACSWLEERLFNIVIGFVHIFCFVNLKDGRTRTRFSLFYLVILAENALFFALWFRLRPDDPNLLVTYASVIFGGYLLGLVCMLCYYFCCHIGDAHAGTSVYGAQTIPISLTPEKPCDMGIFEWTPSGQAWRDGINSSNRNALNNNNNDDNINEAPSGSFNDYSNHCLDKNYDNCNCIETGNMNFPDCPDRQMRAYGERCRYKDRLIKYGAGPDMHTLWPDCPERRIECKSHPHKCTHCHNDEHTMVSSTPMHHESHQDGSDGYLCPDCPERRHIITRATTHMDLANTNSTGYSNNGHIIVDDGIKSSKYSKEGFLAGNSEYLFDNKGYLGSNLELQHCQLSSDKPPRKVSSSLPFHSESAKASRYANHCDGTKVFTISHKISLNKSENRSHSNLCTGGRGTKNNLYISPIVFNPTSNQVKDDKVNIPGCNLHSSSSATSMSLSPLDVAKMWDESMYRIDTAGHENKDTSMHQLVPYCEFDADSPIRITPNGQQMPSVNRNHQFSPRSLISLSGGAQSHQGSSISGSSHGNHADVSQSPDSCLSLLSSDRSYVPPHVIDSNHRNSQNISAPNLHDKKFANKTFHGSGKKKDSRSSSAYCSEGSHSCTDHYSASKVSLKHNISHSSFGSQAPLLKSSASPLSFQHTPPRSQSGQLSFSTSGSSSLPQLSSPDSATYNSFSQPHQTLLCDSQYKDTPWRIRYARRVWTPELEWDYLNTPHLHSRYGNRRSSESRHSDQSRRSSGPSNHHLISGLNSVDLLSNVADDYNHLASESTGKRNGPQTPIKLRTWTESPRTIACREPQAYSHQISPETGNDLRVNNGSGARYPLSVSQPHQNSPLQNKQVNCLEAYRSSPYKFGQRFFTKASRTRTCTPDNTPYKPNSRHVIDICCENDVFSELASNDVNDAEEPVQTYSDPVEDLCEVESDHSECSDEIISYLSSPDISPSSNNIPRSAHSPNTAYVKNFAVQTHPNNRPLNESISASCYNNQIQIPTNEDNTTTAVKYNHLPSNVTHDVTDQKTNLSLLVHTPPRKVNQDLEDIFNDENYLKVNNGRRRRKKGRQNTDKLMSELEIPEMSHTPSSSSIVSANKENVPWKTSRSSLPREPLKSLNTYV